MKQLKKERRLNEEQILLLWKGRCPDCKHFLYEYDSYINFLDKKTLRHYTIITRFKCNHCGEIYEQSLTMHPGEPGEDAYFVIRLDDREKEWEKIGPADEEIENMNNEFRLSEKELELFWENKCPDCRHPIELYDFESYDLGRGEFTSISRFKCDHCRELYEQYRTNQHGEIPYFVDRIDGREHEWRKIESKK